MSSHKRTRISSEGEKRVHQLLRTPNEEKELSGSPLSSHGFSALVACIQTNQSTCPPQVRQLLEVTFREMSILSSFATLILSK